MFILDLKLPNNLHSEMMLECENIPCLVRKNSIFNIDFFETVPHISGQVLEWSWSELNKRVPAGSGGEYMYYKRSLITLERIDKDHFKILDLSMFLNGIGWCKVIENSIYAEPNPNLWDTDPDEY